MKKIILTLKDGQWDVDLETALNDPINRREFNIAVRALRVKYGVYIRTLRLKPKDDVNKRKEKVDIKKEKSDGKS